MRENSRRPAAKARLGRAWRLCQSGAAPAILRARFCLVNIDVDVYEPTRKILELCWERMVPGAVLLLDEYGTSKWPGETRAWDYFARDHRIAAGVKRFPWANAPGAYVIKP